MIRPAKYQDIPVLMAMLHEMHAASKYAGRVDISDKAAEQLLMSAIAAQGQIGPQGSLVIIAEEGGKQIGFMIGILDRVYHIGRKLTANDLFLYVRKGASQKHALALIDNYVSWASNIRAVLDIALSWTDALPGAERITAVYERKGFTKTGGIYEMRRDAQPERIAA